MFKDPRTHELEDKDWTFVIEDVRKNKYKIYIKLGMAPSPSSSLNTPGGVGATPSPQQEDQAYRDKVKQLSKYVEPLRRMIAKMGNEGSK